MFDVVFIHAPSVYDFRKLKRVHYGPISDVVPSTPIFDMYPYGFFSLATYLELNGFKTGIFNIAARMINNPRLDVVKLLKSIKANVYAIDIHWLVHAHGSIEIAKLIKDIHGKPVIVGGLSATIFWKEILEKYDAIDVVVRGDTTEPIVLDVVKALENGRLEELEKIPNIAYRGRDGSVKATPLRFIPYILDDFRPRYDVIVKVFSRSGIFNSLPWNGFFKHPITAIITFKGCLYNCVTCGGSNFAYKKMFFRERLGVKSPKVVFEEFKEIVERLKVPLFFVGDLQLLGRRYIEELFTMISAEKIDIELFFEFFKPPPRDLLQLYRKVGERVYLQISPESPDERVRKAFGRSYTNSELEKFLKHASEMGFERIDLYYMVGLPLQDPENVKVIGEFFEKTYKISKGKIDSFVAPLAPFVDPGSIAYFYPERVGYKLLAKTFEEHRKLLLADKWYLMLNYETKWMTRRQIAEATYNACELLATSKYKLGIIDEKTFYELVESIKCARAGQPKRIEDEKETLKESELYPQKHLPINYLTPKLLWEIVKWGVATRMMYA